MPFAFFSEPSRRAGRSIEERTHSDAGRQRSRTHPSVTGPLGLYRISPLIELDSQPIRTDARVVWLLIFTQILPYPPGEGREAGRKVFKPFNVNALNARQSKCNPFTRLVYQWSHLRR
jgi:hypothetical protein